MTKFARYPTTRSLGMLVLALAGAALVGFSSSPILAVAALAAGLGGGVLWARASRAERDRRTTEATAHISHELRTPLTSVLGIIDVLLDDTMRLEQAEQAELMSLARSEAQHMNHVVSNLLASSRMARDLLEPSSEPIDLRDLVEQALHRLPSVEKRTYVDGHRGAIVSADPALTLQVILNLLQNVERYAPNGEALIDFDDSGGVIAMTLSDDGPGLEPGTAFEGASDIGLGLGLPLSRELARLMGGDLRIVEPRRRGASVQLTLPRSNAPAPRTPVEHRRHTTVVALSPRARLLVDLADALSDRSLDRVVAGLQKQCTDMIGALSMRLFITDDTSGFAVATSFGSGIPLDHLDHAPLHQTVSAARPVEIASLQDSGLGAWADEIGGDAALFVPVIDAGATIAVLVMAWADAADLPGRQGREVAVAMAEFVGFALDRSALSDSAEFERELRSSVMESLPIAISVFAGDPPQVIDWNERERRMLHLAEDVQRPSDLDDSQSLFDVRFADGTPLTVENAPVTQAIRSGRSAGPFLLRVRRLDGSETITRTHCAPFSDRRGRVIGAVVTSEELDVAPSQLAQEQSRERTA